MRVSSSGFCPRGQPHPQQWTALQNTNNGAIPFQESGFTRQAGSLPLSVGIPAAPRALVEPASTLRGGQILAPSGGFSNDASRARNGGKRLCPKPRSQRSPSPKGMGRMSKSASEPMFTGSSSGSRSMGTLPVVAQGGLSCISLTAAASASALDLKTPRTMRGMVRKTSAVQIQCFPESFQLQALGMSSSAPALVGRWGNNIVSQRTTGKEGPKPEEHSWILTGTHAQESGRPMSAPKSQSSPRMRRVTWADDPIRELSNKEPAVSMIYSFKEGDVTEAKKKSKLLMNGLYKLRRVGGNDSPRHLGDAVEESVPLTEEQQKELEKQQKDDEKAATLMNETLASTVDTEAELRLTESMLAGAHEPVAELGGARHATTLVSGRTLSVVKRKADLCHSSEAYLHAFESGHAQKETLLLKVIASTERPLNDTACSECPTGYQGTKRIISSMVHRNNKGHPMNPAEAERAPFEVFVVSYGLHFDHTTLVKLKQLATEATEWWAEETLQQALGGAEADPLQRLINVTIGFLEIKETDNEKLVKVKVVLGDRLAEKVLAIAERLSIKDAGIVRTQEAANPDHARKVADEIDAEIKEAVRLGAPNKHPKLAAAKQIAVGFHFEEQARWALTALQFAKHKKDDDQKMVDKAGDKVPPVGPASEMGDAIERKMSDCLKKGAVESHPHMQEARTLMKWLRDQDGERKRMAAREIRLAEAAEAAKKAEFDKRMAERLAGQ